MKVGFSGTRRGMTAYQYERVLKELVGVDELHHGDCIGSDEEADQAARSVGVHVVIHPPDDDKARAFCFQAGDGITMPLPYLVRNHAIVDTTDRLVATPDTAHETLRSGTWATIRHARSVGRPVVVIPPAADREGEDHA